MARQHYEVFAVERGRAIPNSNGFTWNRELPLGEVWRRILLHFHATVVIGTGTGALAEGLLRWIKSIRVSTGKGDVIVDNVPGRALYQINTIKGGTPADLTTLLASDGTYHALVPIWLVDPLAIRPEDTLLNTARFSESGITIDVRSGAPSDLYSAPGTATVAVTADLYLERQRGRIDAKASPLVVPYYAVRPPVVPSSVAELVLERAVNLAYKRVGLFGSVSAINGVPFTGNADNGVFSLVELEAEYGKIVREGLPAFLRAKNKAEYGLESEIAGLTVFDLVRDGSNQSAFPSAQSSRFSATWTFGAGATPLASAWIEGLRPLIV